MQIQFYCRKAKVDKKGFAPIEVSLVMDYKRTFISLPRKERPLDFKTAIDSKKINDIKEYCEAVRVRLGVIQSEMMLTGKALTVQAVKELFKTGGVRSKTLVELWNDYMDIVAERNVTDGTVRKYMIVRDLFFKVVPNKQVADLIQSDILKFINSLSSYDSTTKAGMVTKLKSVVRYAMDNGLLKVNPFINVKIEKATKEANFLTLAEVQKLIDLDLSFNPSLEIVKDVYLLGIGTGLSYCDLKRLRIEDIKQDKDTYYIEGKRAKTGQKYVSVLMPVAVEIIKKYTGIPRVISNQKINSYLKVIADLAGIRKKITYHSARHTYITGLVREGVDVSVVAKTVGHSNIKMTQRYCHLLKDDIINKVKAVI